jgi:hypothetical protein
MNPTWIRSTSLRVRKDWRDPALPRTALSTSNRCTARRGWIRAMYANRRKPRRPRYRQSYAGDLPRLVVFISRELTAVTRCR